MDSLLCFCDICKGRPYVNAKVFLSPIFKNGQFYLKYHFLCHRNLPLEEIQLRVNCYVSILNFYSPKYQKHCSSLYLAHFGGTFQGPPKGFPYWRQQNKVTKASSKIL